MNMKTLRKILAAICATALIVCISVGATVAYLTSKDQVINTFTVGQVHIELDEAPVDADGKETTGKRVKANSYKLYPGQTYDKDPMVTVRDESDEAFIRMIVTVGDIASLKKAFPANDYPELYNDDVFLLQGLVDWKSTAWPFVEVIEKDNKAVYEFRHYATVSTIDEDDNTTIDDAKAKALAPLFTEITIPGTIDNDGIANLAKVTITVDAHAIQARGFDSADEAWDAFDAQYATQNQDQTP